MVKLLIIAFFVVWCIAMWYAMIRVAIRGWGPHLHSKRQPKTRVNAKVKHKLTREDYSMLTGRIDIAQMILVFECQDGVDRRYDVSDDVFNSVDENDEGVLIYQGYLYEGFESHSKLDIDESFEKMVRN